MIIGIDFDNTIVCYDNVYKHIINERLIVPPHIQANKDNVKKYLIDQGSENMWTRLQGEIYGPLMEYAEPYDGVLDFFKLCETLKIETKIISHRTRYPILGNMNNLHEAAKRWLLNKKIPIKFDKVFFLSTKDEKIRKINSECCDIFIDDLPEIISNKMLKPNIKKILFSNEHMEKYKSLGSWKEITQYIQSYAKN